VLILKYSIGYLTGTPWIDKGEWHMTTVWLSARQIMCFHSLYVAQSRMSKPNTMYNMRRYAIEETAVNNPWKKIAVKTCPIRKRT